MPEIHFNAIRAELAIKFMERAKALGYRGKKKDDAAMDFFVGACNTLALLGEDGFAKAMALSLEYDLAFRGAAILEKWSKE